MPALIVRKRMQHVIVLMEWLFQYGKIFCISNSFENKIEKKIFKGKNRTLPRGVYKLMLTHNKENRLFLNFISWLIDAFFEHKVKYKILTVIKQDGIFGDWHYRTSIKDRKFKDWQFLRRVLLNDKRPKNYVLKWQSPKIPSPKVPSLKVLSLIVNPQMFCPLMLAPNQQGDFDPARFCY